MKTQILKKIKIFLLFYVICFTNIKAFDWAKYLEKYKDLQDAGINRWPTAFMHYLNNGIAEGRTSVENEILDSNFDFEYYVDVNELKEIKNKDEAIMHYQQKGYFLNLSYCKKFNIVILLHLYNLTQINEFADRINYFMKINAQNNYYIKINIPIGKNISNFKISNENSLLISQEEAKKIVSNLIPYPVGDSSIDYMKLYQISEYLKKNLNMNSNKIQIIFTENRGVDIGGFFLLMDQLIKQNIEHDYIVKLHSKTDPRWRKLMNSFLNLRISKILRTNQCIYSNNLYFDFKDESEINYKNVLSLLNLFNLEKKDFNFPGGTIFVASSLFTDFFKKVDLLKLFSMCNATENLPKDGAIEHAFERFLVI